MHDEYLKKVKTNVRKSANIRQAFDVHSLNRDINLPLWDRFWLVLH